MIRAIEIVRPIARRALPEYLAAFDQGDALVASAGITNENRLAHFLAQVLHESGGLTIKRESGTYSAGRIMEIFGVGRHSARITSAEAHQLAGNGPALFERVYGLGNPSKARELGNTQPGDGWAYRGNGLLQTTGRGLHRLMAEKCGLGDLFERQPELVTSVPYALMPALAEWKAGGCNAMADRGDIQSITRRINGGLNGFDDRKAWFRLTDTAAIQIALNTYGAKLGVDGDYGPRTKQAVENFQRDKRHAVIDGIAGPKTRADLFR